MGGEDFPYARSGRKRKTSLSHKGEQEAKSITVFWESCFSLSEKCSVCCLSEEPASGLFEMARKSRAHRSKTSMRYLPPLPLWQKHSIR